MTNNTRLALFYNEFFSALTVSFLTIAAGASFGIFTGVGAYIGIMSMGVASVIGVIFGGIPNKTSGATGPTSNLMYTSVIAITSLGYSHEPFYFILAISSILLFFISFLPLKKIVSFIPNVSISIFINGVSIFILYKQLSKVENYFTFDFDSLIWELFFTVSTVILLSIWPKIVNRYSLSSIGKFISGSLIVMFAGGVINALINPDVKTISIEGHSFISIFNNFEQAFHWPAIPTDLLVILILKTTIVLALITIITGYSIDKNTNVSKELKNQSFTNFAISLFGGIPVTIGLLRTKLLQRTGGKTYLSGVFVGALVILITNFLADILQLIPVAVFTGILIKASWSSIDAAVWKEVKQKKNSLYTALFISIGSIVAAWLDTTLIFLFSIPLWYFLRKIGVFTVHCKDVKNCPSID